MLTSMSFASLAALFFTMLFLASVPSVSVLTVSARSATFGFMHGVFTSFGIVVGDIIFILLAVLGLSVLADKMGELFDLVKCLGGTYLVWLGIVLWRTKSNSLKSERVTDSSLLSSFIAGLLITLGDQKAIIFYLGLLPAFVDLSTITNFDMGMIIVIAIISVGSAKITYAYMADKASWLVSAKVYRVISSVAGGVMVAIGTFLITNIWF